MQEITLAFKKSTLVLQEISLEKLRRGQYQPRQVFSDEGLNSLAETIRRVGILEPLVVRSLSDDNYEIIAGERRWRAAQIAHLQTVPCLIGRYTDEQASQMALIENISREDLNSIDEASAINRIVLEFNYTHEEVAAILGKPRSHITNLLRLLRLDTRVQDLLRTKELSEAHGKILAGLAIDKQHFFATQCLQKNWSSRALVNAVKNLTKDKRENSPKTIKKDVNTLHLEQEISDKFGHSVKLSFDADDKSGYVNIRFSHLDELENVLYKLKEK
jgi:ParB family chromosome partitioning protein